MILSRLSVECFTPPHQPWAKLLLPLLFVGLGACGPKKPAIPADVEAIARRCYGTLVTHERTPKLNPSESMEDGTFLILWSIVEFPDEQGSCTVDGSGTVFIADE